MSDTVNAADVLTDVRAYCPDCRCWHSVDMDEAIHQRDALLDHGDGDRVVLDTDGTLRRGEPLTLWRHVDDPTALRLDPPLWPDQWNKVEAVILTDPVVPAQQ